MHLDDFQVCSSSATYINLYTPANSKDQPNQDRSNANLNPKFEILDINPFEDFTWTQY
jgi:hypothetical protein